MVDLSEITLVISVIHLLCSTKVPCRSPGLLDLTANHPFYSALRKIYVQLKQMVLSHLTCLVEKSCGDHGQSWKSSLPSFIKCSFLVQKHHKSWWIRRFKNPWNTNTKGLWRNKNERAQVYLLDWKINGNTVTPKTFLKSLHLSFRGSRVFFFKNVLL